MKRKEAIQLQLNPLHKRVIKCVKLNGIASPSEIASQLGTSIVKVYKALYELSDIPVFSRNKKPRALDLLLYKTFSNKSDNRCKYAILTYKGEQAYYYFNK